MARVPTVDALDALADLLGTTRRELVLAIVKASWRYYRTQLRRYYREHPEQDAELDVDLWDPEERG